MRAALRPMSYRAGVLTIVRRGSCDCALRLLLEEGTKRTNGNAPPARTGGGACFGTGCIRSGVWPDFSRLRGRRGGGARRATNRTIFVAGLGRCARHGGWPKRFSRRGRRGGMARRVADRTLRSDVTGGRPRAVVLAIVRRGSCDCALRLMLEEGTKRTNGKRAPARMGGGRVFWDGGAAAGLFLRRGWGGASGRVLPNFCAVGRIVRGNVTGGAMVRGVRRATNRTVFVAGRGRCVRHDGWPKRFLRRGRRGGMARRVADRTLRSDVTGGRPRAVVLAIVRRGSCDCALRLMLEEGTKRTNGERAPRPYGRGRVFWDGALLPDCFYGGAGAVRPVGCCPIFARLAGLCAEM